MKQKLEVDQFVLWLKQKTNVFFTLVFSCFSFCFTAIAVTFSGILHHREECVTIAMTERIFDKKRERRGKARKMKSGVDETREEDRELHLRHLITSTAGHFTSDILVSHISSIFFFVVFLIC